jgi:hypothetical protein
MVVAEHPSESLAPDDWVVKFANDGDGLQQPVAECLMIPGIIATACPACDQGFKFVQDFAPQACSGSRVTARYRKLINNVR